MSEEIIKVLDDLGKRFGIVLDWSNENVIPYIQDLIIRIGRLELFNHILSLAISIIFLILTILLFKEFAQEKDNNDSDYGEVLVTGIILSSIASVIFLIVGLINLGEVIFLPEVTAFKYIKGML